MPWSWAPCNQRLEEASQWLLPLWVKSWRLCSAVQAQHTPNAHSPPSAPKADPTSLPFVGFFPDESSQVHRTLAISIFRSSGHFIITDSIVETYFLLYTWWLWNKGFATGMAWILIPDHPLTSRVTWGAVMEATWASVSPNHNEKFPYFFRGLHLGTFSSGTSLLTKTHRECSCCLLLWKQHDLKREEMVFFPHFFLPLEDEIFEERDVIVSTITLPEPCKDVA